MPDFSLDYNTLYQIQSNLHTLADQIGPQLKDTAFAAEGNKDYGESDATFGNSSLAESFRLLYTMAEDPMNRAEERLKQLGDLFGAVADAYFNVDAQIADGLGILGGSFGLSNWRYEKSLWDYKQAHLDQCVAGPDGSMPYFCSATDPGAPPLDVTTSTGNGSVRTQLTLDDQGNVIREESWITHDGHSYHSVTNYTNDRNDYTTVTTFADGSTNTTVVHLNPDRSGTMSVTGSDGKVTQYTRSGPDSGWQEVGGGSGDQPGDQPDDRPHPEPHPPSGTSPDIA
ncbi:hypothetical protein [Dactylosporangium sp. CA-092794]|uniref:hypothetical protein n=1 Tax=Dactylosporangium sp. CA-092794 TaxID=3239929 RepID=UPI003D8B4574